MMCVCLYVHLACFFLSSFSSLIKNMYIICVCVCAGAGKTYTMLGEAGEPGIMALTLNDLFTLMEERREDNLYNVTMAYLEVCV